MTLTCRDVMPTDQTVLRPTDTVSKAFSLMRDKGMRYLPVVKEDGTYVGVFTSPTLIKLLLPQATTIELGGSTPHTGLQNLNFLSTNAEDFYAGLSEVKNQEVQQHLSDSKNIPVTAPDTPIMEGVLLLHQFKRHVILVEPDTNQFVGVMSINSTLRKVFDSDQHV